MSARRTDGPFRLAMTPWLAWAILGAVAAAGCALTWGWDRPITSDLYQVYAAAPTLWAGGNPYDVVGPGKPVHWDFPLFYPLPAVVLLSPLGWLPPLGADAVFVAVATGLCVWVALRQGVSPLVWMFPSLAYLNAVERAQWSPLIVAITCLPWLGFVAAAKPTIAGALWLAYPSRHSLILAASFTGLVTAIWPWWIEAWLMALRDPTGEHLSRPLLLSAGGPVLLAALWRWREPSARLLVAMACIPQTPHMYEAVPLFLIPQTHREGQLLCVLSIVAKLLWTAGRPYPDHASGAAIQGQWMLWLLYWPCLVMVLAQSPKGTNVR